MARKKSGGSLLMGLVVDTGKAISAAHKAAVKERERQERLAIQRENQRIRELKRAEAERARIEREKLKREKEEAKQRAHEEAEKARLAVAYASLNDRYAYAIKRHEEIEKMRTCIDDNMLFIELCKEDIRLYPMLYDFATRNALIEGNCPKYPALNGYLLLSEAYERAGDKQRAIQVCKDALEMGIVNAGKYTMEQRIQMLQDESRGEI